MLETRRAGPDDADLLSRLAARTFHDAYAATAAAADLATHLARAFGPEQQAAELADPHLVTLLASVQGNVVGFAQVMTDPSHPAPACVPAAAPIELTRFYLEQAWAGRGVARPLMDRVLEIAQGSGGDAVWLTVWCENARAIRFYEKCGFIHRGEAPYRFADRIEQDWVMVRALPV